MILNGPRLLSRPQQAWDRIVAGRSHRPAWLVSAALTAAIWPGVAAVAGHLGSGLLGFQEINVAALRAAVGLTAAVGGAMVMAPALTLALIWSTSAAHAAATARQTGPVAMGLLWPVWFAGTILALPPLVGFGPEVGEIAWSALAAILVVRAIFSGATKSLGIRRRWANGFAMRTAAAFVFLFLTVSVAPAMVARGILGVSRAAEVEAPKKAPLPLPPEPNW